MKSKIAAVLVIIALLTVGFVCVRYYSYVFAKSVEGEIIGIERVTQPAAILGNSGQIPSSQLFSFAVALRTPKNEIITASSEDRQWAVVQKGQCAEVKFFPYPPWDFEKSGTFHGARLQKLFDCPVKK